MTTEELLMEVVRMLREREVYSDKEWLKANEEGQFSYASMMLSESLAYNSARQMLMAALTNNIEILREFDQFHEGEEN